MIEKKARKFCPKCLSEDVKINITPSSVFGAPQKWVCNSCGFESFIFPEKLQEVKIE